MSSEQPLLGLNSACNIYEDLHRFHKLENEILIKLPELIRFWNRLGRPTVHHLLKPLLKEVDLPSFQANLRDFYGDVSDFLHLVEAMLRIQNQSRAVGRVWRFPEIRQIIEIEKLWPHLQTRQSEPRTRSALGRALGRYLNQKFPTTKGTVYLQAMKDNRRVYFLVEET